MADNKPEVAVIMGSASDWETMKHACEMLDQFEVPYMKQVISAHRTPELMGEFAHNARANGLKVIIAGAGGAKPPCRSSACRCVPMRCPAGIRCCPSFRCRAVFRSPPLRSAIPVPQTRAFWL